MEPTHHKLRAPSSTLLVREQEEHAARLINRVLADAAKNGQGIDAATARVIAATLHAGHGSHLEYFAATGALHSGSALAELDDERTEPHPLLWAAALRVFLHQRHTLEATASWSKNLPRTPAGTPRQSRP